MQIDNKLTNFEIDRLVSEHRLNRVKHNNAHLGLMDLNRVVDKYHFGKQHKIPTPKPILENDLLGTNIDADLPRRSHINLNELNRENNIYSFNIHGERRVKKSLESYNGLTSNLYGIPSFEKKRKLETNEGKMYSIAGKSNNEIMIQNWRSEMSSDPRSATLINTSKTPTPLTPSSSSSSSSSSSPPSTPPPDLSPITPPSTPVLKVGTVSNLLKSDDKKNQHLNLKNQ